MKQEEVKLEETLDPADWSSMRQLAHQMVDDMLDYLSTVRERPVWQPVPDDVRSYFTTSAPLDPQPPHQVYQDFLNFISPYPMGNIHPRFWGWVMGNGTVMGVLADMLASTVNPNMGGANHAGVYVEQQVIEWLKGMMGFPPQSSGLLVTGASMANLVGLAVARSAGAGYDVRREGLQAAPRPLTIYCSAETHSSVQKAVELLGLGTNALRKIPVDSSYHISLPALQEAIQQDRQAGLQPIAVIGNAGTVNTGAVDDLNALADLCQQEKLWFHVDGAFGSLARLSPQLEHLVSGLERADSIAFDLHKWLYLPFEAGCVLVRHPDLHRETFSVIPEYLAHSGERGLASGAFWFSEYGVQLTRGFRALKVWMSLKEHGVRKFGRLIQQNADQARYLAELVEETPQLELTAPVELNIVCFRFWDPSLSDESANALNQELLVRLHESGIAVPTYTTLNGRYTLRACIINHRSTRADFDLLVQAVVRLGRDLLQEQVSASSAPA
jgi:aromatic-L-amino-acid/L-tryptophan decarboxylase